LKVAQGIELRASIGIILVLVLVLVLGARRAIQDEGRLPPLAPEDEDEHDTENEFLSIRDS
jgi:hypothetical protein